MWPYVADEMLSGYLPGGGVVVDPFLGSGTALVEAARRGLPVFGSDVNPSILTLSRVYQLANLDGPTREDALSELSRQLTGAMASFDAASAFDAASNSADRASLESALVDLWHRAPAGLVRDLTAVFLGVCNFHRRSLSPQSVAQSWTYLVDTVRALPRSQQPVTVAHADARSLPLEADTVDLALTAPVHLGHYNYGGYYRRTAEALGWDVDYCLRHEIGNLGRSQFNIFRALVRYCLDMALALREMVRVVRPGGRIILVVGTRWSMLGDVRVANGDLLHRLGVRCLQLGLDRRDTRYIDTRDGREVPEEYLHFIASSDGGDEGAVLEAARDLARSTLENLLPTAPADARPRIAEALAHADIMEPTPIYPTPTLWPAYQ